MSLLSIDGSFMLHRARFVVANKGTSSRDAVVALFMNMFMRLLIQFKASHVYIYFDRERSRHRLKLYPDYKGHRKEEEGDLSLVAYKLARDFLVEILPTLGFTTVLEDGIEADDFGYLTAHTYEQGIHVTDDKDWFGSLFPGWALFRPKANEYITYQDFCEMVSHHENPRMIYLIARAIVGDKSDNIPGIKKVKWEEALLLAPRIFLRQDLGDERYAQRVFDNLDQVRHNISIMTPMWVLRSEEAQAALKAAEEKREQNLSSPFVPWKRFYEQLDSFFQRDMVRLSLDYNVVVKGLL